MRVNFKTTVSMDMGSKNFQMEINMKGNGKLTKNLELEK